MKGPGTALVVWLALALAAACGDSVLGRAPGVAPPGERPKYLERLSSPADFARVQGEEGEVKYLGKVDGRRGLPPVDKPCMFQDTARFAGHVTFLRSFPELATLDFATYLTLVEKNASRQLWGGELKLFSGAVHPRTGARGILAYFVYADDAASEALSIDQLAEVDARLKGCVPYAKELLVLAAATQTQATHFAEQAAALRARGVDTIAPSSLRPKGGAEGYSLGESYGYLRVVPRGQKAADYGPRDVLVVQSTAEDLSLVAGLVTELPQNLHSHVNLRLREKSIPNASVPDIYQNSVLPLLDGKLVHLVVDEAAVRLEPALLETATAFWAAHRQHVALPAPDLATTALRPVAALRHVDALAYGTKAANVGQLGAILPATNAVTTGFGVPFSVYVDFMKRTGLQSKVDALLADPRAGEDATFRRAALAALRGAIEAAPVPAPTLASLRDAATAAFGAAVATTPLKFRSSSNVEDGEVISGAGLHDSLRACFGDDEDADATGPSVCLAADERAELAAQLAARNAELAAHPERDWLPGIVEGLRKDLSNERGAARALRKVYASLWNDRAFEERAYWGVDQRQVAMGVLVEPSFVLEKVNAVAATNLDGGGGAPLYRVVSQRGDESVVRPEDPTLVAETLVFRRGAGDGATDVQRLTTSSLSATPLWSDAQLAELARLLFLVQDDFAKNVYPTTTPLALDLEIKVTRDDRIVFKQARPYLETN
jgi:hypothetical protein